GFTGPTLLSSSARAAEHPVWARPLSFGTNQWVAGVEKARHQYTTCSRHPKRAGAAPAPTSCDLWDNALARSTVFLRWQTTERRVKLLVEWRKGVHDDRVRGFFEGR